MGTDLARKEPSDVRKLAAAREASEAVYGASNAGPTSRSAYKGQ